MKILSLKMTNFRQFYGRQELHFSTDSKKNITLIHAENGVGKTALLNAIYNTPRKLDQKIAANKIE